MPRDRTCSAIGPRPSGQTSARHVPVTKAGAVVAPRPEPPVVHHEPLDADLRRDVGERCQPIERMVEVHGFPGVEHDRPRTLRMARSPPQHAVQPSRRAVDTRAGVDAVDPRRRDRFAGTKDHLTGRQDLPRAEQHRTGVQPLSEIALVARPAEMDAPHLTVAIVEALACRPSTTAANQGLCGRVAVRATRCPGARAAAAPALRSPICPHGRTPRRRAPRRAATSAGRQRHKKHDRTTRCWSTSAGAATHLLRSRRTRRRAASAAASSIPR